MQVGCVSAARTSLFVASYSSTPFVRNKENLKGSSVFGPKILYYRVLHLRSRKLRRETKDELVRMIKYRDDRKKQSFGDLSIHLRIQHFE